MGGAQAQPAVPEGTPNAAAPAAMPWWQRLGQGYQNFTLGREEPGPWAPGMAPRTGGLFGDQGLLARGALAYGTPQQRRSSFGRALMEAGARMASAPPHMSGAGAVALGLGAMPTAFDKEEQVRRERDYREMMAARGEELARDPEAAPHAVQRYQAAATYPKLGAAAQMKEVGRIFPVPYMDPRRGPMKQQFVETFEGPKPQGDAVPLWKPTQPSPTHLENLRQAALMRSYFLNSPDDAQVRLLKLDPTLMYKMAAGATYDEWARLTGIGDKYGMPAPGVDEAQGWWTENMMRAWEWIMPGEGEPTAPSPEGGSQAPSEGEVAGEIGRLDQRYPAPQNATPPERPSQDPLPPDAAPAPVAPTPAVQPPPMTPPSRTPSARERSRMGGTGRRGEGEVTPFFGPGGVLFNPENQPGYQRGMRRGPGASAPRATDRQVSWMQQFGRGLMGNWVG